jgi:hypothetical protein
MYEPFAHCADAPAEHDAAEPGGRRDFPDDDVGGDFEEDVSALLTSLVPEKRIQLTG